MDVTRLNPLLSGVSHRCISDDGCRYRYDGGDPTDPRQEELVGASVRAFHSLVPLDEPTRGARGLPSTLFKAVSSQA